MAEAPPVTEGTSVHQSPEHTKEQLPDFFLLGAAKSGTTSLHHYLRQHPALYLPKIKELDFFDAPKERFETNLDWYLRYFRDASGRFTGEATPLYFRRPDTVAKRMCQLYGDTPPRFLLLLRDPVDRAYSHYLHKVSQGTEPLSFKEALDAEREHPQQKQRAWKSYFQDGLYAERLEALYKYFPPEQFLILLSMDLWRRPRASLRSIFRFFEVDPEIEIDTSPRLNRTAERRSRTLGAVLSVLPRWLPPLLRSWTPESLRLWIEQVVRRGATSDRDRPQLDPQIDLQLRSAYEPSVRRLADLIDRDLSEWLPGEKECEPSPNRYGPALTSGYELPRELSVGPFGLRSHRT